MGSLPTGTVTFVLTDIEGSTRLWARSPDAAGGAVRSTYDILDQAIAAHGGHRPVEQGEGDSTVSVFTTATAAVRAALAAQLALYGAYSRGELPVTVRIAVHTGDAELRDESNYMGAAVIRCARLRALASGGDVLVSSTTAALVADDPPVGAVLVDLGEHTLRDLPRPERVWRLAHPDLPHGQRLRGTTQRARTNLRAPATPLVGRERERAKLNEEVERSSIVTLTGSGGVGKTRLALAVATDLVDRFPDGVWVVELASVTDPARVPAAVAASLGVLEVPGHPITDSLADFARDRAVVVLLDNCEHVIDAVADVAVGLTEVSPSSRVLATSREPLGVPGEVTWRTPSLPFPAGDGAVTAAALRSHPATELFCQRAEDARPGFVVTDGEAALVVEMCRRLDGVPLAIELAASRVRSMSLCDLHRSLDERFLRLTGGARTALPRQRTLTASVGWSYDLLDDVSRHLFRRLSVFAGAFSADAVLKVCSDEVVGADVVLDVLSALVDRSLVEHLGDGTYRLLETLRQYAQEQAVTAAEIGQWRDRHLQWCRELAPSLRVGPALGAAGFHLGLSLLPDLRRGFEWSLLGDDPAVDLVPTIASLQDWSARHDDNLALGTAVRTVMPEPEDPLRVTALAGLGNVPFYAADFDTLAAQAEALAYASHDVDRSRLLLATGERDLFDGRSEGVASMIRAADLARSAGSADDEATAMLSLAYFLSMAGRLREARPVIERLETLCVAADGPMAGGLSVARGFVTLGTSVPTAAEAFLEQVRASGSHPSPRASLAAAALLTEDEVMAAEALGSDRWSRVGGAYLGLAGFVRAVSSLLRGDHAAAADALGSTLESFTMGNVSYWLRLLDADLALHQHDGERAARRADEVRIGIADRTLPTNEALLALVDAELALRNDEIRRAQDLAHHVLRLGVDHDAPLIITDGLEAVAVASALLGNGDHAARLAGAAAAHRRRAAYRWRHCVLHRIEGVRAAASEAFETGLALTLAEAVAQATRTRGTRNRAMQGWDALTPAEVDVALLAADGLRTNDIAAKLFVSPATVKTHLHHIYGKLQVSSRAELARAAARQN